MPPFIYGQPPTTIFGLIVVGGLIFLVLFGDCMTTRVMKHPAGPKQDSAPRQAAPPAPPAPAWVTYTGVSQYIGTSPSGKVNVWVDPSLGSPGLLNTMALLADADRIAAANDGFFGSTLGPVNVMVWALGGATDGTGGALHGGCDVTTGGEIEVCAAFTQAARVSALFEAELSECSMGGNLCGVSTGEALSRWCANSTSPGALADFASGPSWQQAGYPNWVDQTQPTDGDYPSIGCGMVFISWLLAKGYTLSQVSRALVSLTASGTLANLYAAVTGHVYTEAWPTFLTAVKALPNGVRDDDPFKGSVPVPPPPPQPTPTPVPLPTELFDVNITRDRPAHWPLLLVPPVAIPKGLYEFVLKPKGAGLNEAGMAADHFNPNPVFSAHAADSAGKAYYFTGLNEQQALQFCGLLMQFPGMQDVYYVYTPNGACQVMRGTVNGQPVGPLP